MKTNTPTQKILGYISILNIAYLLLLLYGKNLTEGSTLFNAIGELLTIPMIIATLILFAFYTFWLIKKQHLLLASIGTALHLFIIISMLHQSL